MLVSASYSEKYFSEKYRPHEFGASISQEIPDDSAIASVHGSLTQRCQQLVAAQIARFDAKVKAEQAATAASAERF